MASAKHLFSTLLIFTLGLYTKTTFAFTEKQLLSARDAFEYSHFGQAISISGDKFVVGAFADDDSGSAYIFTKDPSKTWIQTDKLRAIDAASGDRFGVSVGIWEDTIVVGAHFDDDAGMASGSAYVFTAKETSWEQTMKLTASDATSGDYFGNAVAIADDIILVGAYAAEDSSGASVGAVYVFEKNSDGVWLQTNKLTASDAASDDSFGRAVAISGDTIVVGAYKAADDAGDKSGAVYIFNRETDGTWSQTSKLTDSDAASGDSFGRAVAIDNSTIVIGAYQDEGTSSDSGSAIVFEKNDEGTWSQVAKLTASDATEDAYFGYAVCVKDDKIFVGAYGDMDQGSVYFFEKNSSDEWIQASNKMTASDAGSNELFGESLAVDDGTVVVGAGLNTELVPYSGSAYVFYQGEYYLDADGDGVGSSDLETVFGDKDSILLSGYSESDGDCDDTNASAYPGATEICDGQDNDCDGTGDDAFDLDADSYFSGTCPGLVVVDCDDTNSKIHPGALEKRRDRVDNNCNGVTDEIDPIFKTRF